MRTDNSRVWEWGRPRSGPNAPVSGEKVAATVRDGNYPDQEAGLLILPALDLSTATRPVLHFKHWYDIEAGFDGGCVQASAAGMSTFPILPPGDGYPYLEVSALGGRPAYSGQSGGYVDAVVDLSRFAGRTGVQIVFFFAADGDRNAAGWYVDDVLVAEETVVAARLGPDPFWRAGGGGRAALREGFESGLGGWQVQAGRGRPQWEAGTPSGGTLPPLRVPEGAQVAGTVLSADYDRDLRDQRLVSPFIDLAGATRAELRFAHHVVTEGSCDGGRVLVTPDGVTFHPIDPQGGYWTSSVRGLHRAAGYSGVRDLWRTARFDLTPLLSSPQVGTRFAIAFDFGSDTTVQYSGWFIDDVSVRRD